MRTRSQRFLMAAAGAALVLLVACSPKLTKDDQRALAIERSFLGKFVGTLEYRDYSSDRRVTLPTRMTGTREDDGAIRLDFEYDEGGGRVERGTTLLDVDGPSRTLTFTTEGGKRVERYRIEGFGAFTGLGELIVSGNAEDDGKPVDVRILYSVAPEQLTWTKDTRPPGGAFSFRHRYTMKRARGAPR